jgi:hypothetical protein
VLADRAATSASSPAWATRRGSGPGPLAGRGNAGSGAQRRSAGDKPTAPPPHTGTRRRPGSPRTAASAAGTATPRGPSAHTSSPLPGSAARRRRRAPGGAVPVTRAPAAMRPGPVARSRRPPRPAARTRSRPPPAPCGPTPARRELDRARHDTVEVRHDRSLLRVGARCSRGRHARRTSAAGAPASAHRRSGPSRVTASGPTPASAGYQLRDRTAYGSGRMKRAPAVKYRPIDRARADGVGSGGSAATTYDTGEDAGASR